MIVEYLVAPITSLISLLGYFGIFILMVMESMVFPVPSELVMPFAGFLIADGRFTFAMVLVASSLGSVAGSLISYWIGKFGGRPLLLKYGKFLLLNEHHLEYTENFFRKSGEKTIFISRFVPVVRHLISVPAGIAEMNMKKFLIFTAAGATIWNLFLAFVGFKLRENWDTILKYSSVIDIIILAVLVFVVLYLIIKKYLKK